MPEVLTPGSVTLPTQKQEATRLSPHILVLYGLPKVGKTKVVTELNDCLILDTEDGTAMYECMSLKVENPADFYNIGGALNAAKKQNIAAGKTGNDVYPYKYLCVDTLDMLEDYAEKSATIKFKNNKGASKEFKESGETVLELPHGLGYHFLREEMMYMILSLSKFCQYLILNVHVKEKLLTDKKGDQVKVNDISLTGKLGSMVCAKADAIGYLYRDKDNKLMVSFQTSEGNVMGARQPHLAGQKFEFDWKKIYVD